LVLYSIGPTAFILIHGSEDGTIVLPDGYHCPPIKAVEKFQRWNPDSLSGAGIVYVLACHSSSMQWGRTKNGVQVKPVLKSRGSLWLVGMRWRTFIAADFNPGNYLSERALKFLPESLTLSVLGRLEKKLCPERKTPFKLYKR